MALTMPSTEATKSASQQLLSQDRVLIDTTGSIPSGRSVAAPVETLNYGMKAGTASFTKTKSSYCLVPVSFFCTPETFGFV